MRNHSPTKEVSYLPDEPFTTTKGVIFLTEKLWQPYFML